MKRVLIIIAAGCALVWIALSVSRRAASASTIGRPSVGHDNANGELDELRKLGLSIERMNSRIGNLEIRMAYAANAAAHSPAIAPQSLDSGKPEGQKSEAREEPQELAREERAEREQHAFKRYFDIVDQLRMSERRDPDWQRSVRERARDVLERTADSVEGSPASLTQSHLANVDCGSTVCRIEATHESVEAQDEYQKWFLRGMRSNASLWRQDGKTVVYVAREGHTLPVWNEVLSE